MIAPKPKGLSPSAPSGRMPELQSVLGEQYPHRRQQSNSDSCILFSAFCFLFLFFLAVLFKGVSGCLEHLIVLCFLDPLFD